MNERIKELAERANAWYPLGYPSGEGGDEEWQNLVIFQKEDLQKFSELILQGCIDLLEHDTRDIHPRSHDYCVSLIKEHFGIK